MGLMDYLKTQLLEIIQWQDDSRDTISWRFPDEDKEIKRGAQLIVRESQTAQFVYLGQFGDTEVALDYSFPVGAIGWCVVGIPAVVRRDKVNPI